MVRRGPEPVEGAHRTLLTADLHSALPSALVVFVALALVPETVNMISGTELALMRGDAWLVNVARGRHVDTPALVQALAAREVGGAALDVTEPEPLPAGHPLWSLPNCLVTPHTADTDQMVQPLLAGRIADNVARLASGRPLVGTVDVVAGYLTMLAAPDLRLGRLLAEGGEGRVFEIDGPQELVRLLLTANGTDGTGGPGGPSGGGNGAGPHEPQPLLFKQLRRSLPLDELEPLVAYPRALHQVRPGHAARVASAAAWPLAAVAGPAVGGGAMTAVGGGAMTAVGGGAMTAVGTVIGRAAVLGLAPRRAAPG